MQLAGEAFTNAYVIKRAIPEFSRLQSEIYTFFTWCHKDRLWKCSLCPYVFLKMTTFIIDPDHLRKITFNQVARIIY